jgi:MFS-type transporter involved in bile tolerance (Atg22 family)
MLHSVALVAVLGSVTNDSGVVVAAAMLLTTAPLVLVACLKGSGDAE